MTDILYTFDRTFMRKTYAAVDRHVDAPTAFLPLSSETRGCSDALTEVPVADRSVDDAVAAVDPDIVVRNHTRDPGGYAFDDRTVVHLRHGASIGRGEIDTTVDSLDDVVDIALAPGERWARGYERGFDSPVEVAVVGVPEADPLVADDPPRERRVLYAPTNHNYGGGSYLATAEGVLDAFAHTDFEVLFRPHPMDRVEEPGRSLTERCRRRIADLPNVVFDESDTPLASLRRSDVLLSDYSGIVTEWLHTDRPLVQLDALAGDRDLPAIGTVTAAVDIDLVADLYEHGPPPSVAERKRAFRADLGVPMDGRAGERAAAAIESCTA